MYDFYKKNLKNMNNFIYNNTIVFTFKDSKFGHCNMLVVEKEKEIEIENVEKMVLDFFNTE